MGNMRVSAMVHFVHFSHSAAHSDVNVSAFKTQYKSVKNDDTPHDSAGSIQNTEPSVSLVQMCWWWVW